MISAEAFSAARMHAVEVYPKESVGYVKAGAYVRMENISETPEKAFSVSEADELMIAEQGIDCLIHSHTNGRNFPSKADLEAQQEMQVPWGIVVLRAKTTQDSTPIFIDQFEFGNMPVQPYEGRAFRYGVLDCRVLALDWLKQELGVELDVPWDEYGWWERNESFLLKSLLEAGCTSVKQKDARRGDLVLMNVNSSVPNHVGIYLGNGQLLHHPVNRNSRIIPIETWRGVIDSYMRAPGQD